MSIKDHVVLALMAILDLYWPRVGFMGPGKPSSPVTILSNRPSLLWGDLLEGEWGSPGWWPGWTIVGAQDFIPEGGTQFQLSRNFTNGCRTWDPQGPHVWCVGQVLSLNSVHRFESPWHSRIWVAACPLLSSCSMSCCIDVLDQRMLVVVMLSWWLLYYFIYDVDYFVDDCFTCVL
jgi:hypothetical protein